MNVNTHKKLLAAMIGAAVAGGTLAAQAAEVKLKFGAQADYYRGDAGTATTVPEQAFTIRRARLYFDAKITDLVSASIGLQADDSSAGARTGTLKDASIDLNFHPLAMVRTGMYKYEFDMEGRESSFVRPFMNRSIATNVIAANMGVAGTDFRDKGVSLIGVSEAFGYGVGLWQGVGADLSDNNDKFGYTANVWGKLAGVKANLGYLTSDNTPAGTAATSEYKASVIGVAYEAGPFLVRGEFYDAERETAATVDASGYYVMGVFTVVPNVDLMARFQQFEDEAFGASNNEVTSTDLGVKYYFERKGRGGSNVSLNYMLRDADTGVTQRIFDERGGNVTGDNVDDVIMARLQVQY
jgi:phosphate-selective porin